MGGRKHRKKKRPNLQGTRCPILPNEEIIVFSKEEIIRRQLDTALWLWFFEVDVVSVNALVWNALGQLHAIGKKLRRALDFLLRDQTVSLIASGLRREQGQLKHSDSKLEGDTEITPAVVEWMLFDAIMLLGQIYKKRSTFMSAFLAWFDVFWNERAGGSLAENIEKLRSQGVVIEEFKRIYPQGGFHRPRSTFC